MGFRDVVSGRVYYHQSHNIMARLSIKSVLYWVTFRTWDQARHVDNCAVCSGRTSFAPWLTSKPTMERRSLSHISGCSQGILEHPDIYLVSSASWVELTGNSAL